MPDFAPINLGTVLYVGPYDWDAIQDYIFDEFKNWDPEESKHKHKKGGSGYENEIDWRFEINHSDFWRYHVSFNWHIWGITKKEVVVNGKKKKMDHGRVEFKMKVRMEYDWQGNYKSGIKAKLLNFYVWTVKKNEFFVTMHDPLKYKMLKVHENIKKIIGVTGFNPRGYKSE